MDIDLLSRQTPGFSGADIANVCNEAALHAARANKSVIQGSDFMSAIDRIVGGLEKKTKITTEEEKRAIAIHEAGHATVSWLLEHANPLIKVTIVPRGRSLGAAWYLPEERQITTTEQLLDEMCATLGGRAAEFVTYGKISTGAANDCEEENYSTKLWIGDYSYDNKLNIFTENAEGIKRLGVIRADVDNLGQSFVRGFSTKDASLTRSAVFSRNMSLFFKYHINYLLENGEFSLTGENPPIKRKALIVYSGGDDIFVVGAWDDIIGFSIDLVKSLKKFTLNSLTISAGLGLFAEKFPIKSMAEITGNLEVKH